jgi:hypothetical protein
VPTEGFITFTPIQFDLTRHELLNTLADAINKNDL